MFLRWKRIDGAVALKARFVIGGHLQEKETIGDTFSPTVNPETVHLVIVLAAHSRRKLYTVDVTGAFLHVPLSGAPVHMRLAADIAAILIELDPSFAPYLRPDGTLVVRIRKA